MNTIKPIFIAGLLIAMAWADCAEAGASRGLFRKQAGAAQARLDKNPAPTGTVDLGRGFSDHGVAKRGAASRGLVTTVDGKGRDVVLVLLADYRGCFSLLMIDAETGASEQFPMPFDPKGDTPFTSLLSTGNRFYAHFGAHFCEFDPVKRAFTLCKPTAPQMGMSMTEDDRGVIWSVSYPQNGLVSFDPATRAFRDYGPLYTQSWAQYPRSMAADDAGWIYIGVGLAQCQILIVDPRTGAVKPFLSEQESMQWRGRATVYRDMDGKVYAYLRGAKTGWFEFYRGEARPVEDRGDSAREKPAVTGAQDLFGRQFPSGRRLGGFDLETRELVLEGPGTGETKRVSFDYASEGGHIMGVAAGPDDGICGAAEGEFFSYDPKTDQWTRRPGFRQWNSLTRAGDRLYIGAYPGGYLLEWDASRPWTGIEPDNTNANPRQLTRCSPLIDRPHKEVMGSDGHTLVFAGAPTYGRTGGGLLLWDTRNGARTLLDHTAIATNLTTMSLVALPDGKILAGTSTRPGSGGIRKADEAVLYILDTASKKIEWQAPVLPGAHEYVELCPGPNGLVYGLAGFTPWNSLQLTYGRRFFVFDPVKKVVVHEADTARKFGTFSYQQGPRNLVCAPDGSVYLLFMKGIARVDPSTYALKWVARSPVPIKAGGDILDGRLYFSSGSRLCSYRLDTGL